MKPTQTDIFGAESRNMVSLFCGGGGETIGQHLAFRDLGIENEGVTHHALNHWSLAIAAHRSNMPWIHSHQEDIEAVSAATFGLDHITMLHASPSCTHHSRARGGKPCDEQLRSHAWEVIERWLAVATVDVFTLENVEEWMEWGPLYEDHNNGCGGLVQMRKRKKGSKTRPPAWRCEKPECHYHHPIPGYRGYFFVSFVLALQDLGYAVDWRILNAADYGDPTTRRRLYLQAVRDGRPIVWPRATHRNPKAKRGVYDPSLPTWRPASDCIDWSDLGQSIFERAKPLAPATMRRIAAGLVKFVLGGKPFIVGVGGRAAQTNPHGVDAPFGTVTSKADSAVVTPFLASLRGTAEDQIRNTAASAEDPLRTVSAGGNHAALIAPFLAQVGYGERAGQTPRTMDVQAPLGTVVAGGGKHAVIAPYLTSYHGPRRGGEARGVRPDDPVPTIDTANRYGLVAPILATIDQQSTGDSAVRSVTDPMSTATTKARHAVVSAFLERNFGGGENGTPAPAVSLDSPTPTVTGNNHASLVAAFLTEYYSQGTTAQGLDDPLHTVTTLARHGLVTVDIDGQTYVITDIRMRMLQPAELAKAMGFPGWYRWCDASGRPFSKRDAVKMIGNACDVATVRELVKAIVMARPGSFGLARGAA